MLRMVIKYQAEKTCVRISLIAVKVYLIVTWLTFQNAYDRKVMYALINI